jgi:ASC-1-like (ASCH) protein
MEKTFEQILNVVKSGKEITFKGDFLRPGIIEVEIYDPVNNMTRAAKFTKDFIDEVQDKKYVDNAIADLIKRA